MPEAEILIIGGGIAGASTAWHLAKRGHDVALVERGQIASEASGVNNGTIGAMGWGPNPTLNDYITTGSLEIFKSLQLDLGYDIEFRQSGTLRAIHNEQQYDYSRHQVERLRAQGYRAELLTNREARTIEPNLNPELPGFFFSPLTGQADPAKATRAFADAARKSGARILTGYDVSAIKERGDGGYVVATSRGEFHSQTLVIAAGAWCAPVGEMLGLKIPIAPVRGQMWATEGVPPRVFHGMSSTESPLHWSKETSTDDAPPELTHHGDARVTRHLYGRQRQNGEIIFGGDRQLVGFDKNPDASGIEVNRGHAMEILPFLKDLPIKRTWAGLMPFSLDGKPVLGKIPQRDNLYVVSGLASSGFGRGPMAGKLVADYISTGHMPHVLAEADPARCVTEMA